MDYNMTHKAPFPMVEVTLSLGEEIRIEPSSMVYCDPCIEFKTKLNRGSKGGGILSALGRSLASGESMFIMHVRAAQDNAKIALGCKMPGEIHELRLGAEQWRIRDQAFLACDSGVNYSMKRQSLSQAFFGATGGLFVMETEGAGRMLITSCGSLHRIDLDGKNPLIVDNTHVVAWSSTLDYKTNLLGGGSWLWDGIVCEFRGVGSVIVQTSCRLSPAKQASST